MASLIPDVGNIRTSTDTAGAMSNYLKAMANTREAFAAPVDLIDKVVAGNEARKKTEEEQRRWDITNARADALAKRQEDEYNRALSEKNATNEAYRVLINKDQYANEKMAAEQKAIQETLAMLTPEERAEAEQGLKSYYNPEVSRQQWIDNAINGPDVDQSKVVAMKTNLYNIAANTPGTPEYQAKIDADREQKKWALDLENKYKMAQLAMENKNRLAQIEASNKEAKPVGTDLFYVPTTDGGYAPQYISKGGAVPTGAKSESIYKEMLKKNNDSSSGGGSGEKPGGTQYITGGTDLEANAKYNRVIDIANMVGGSKDASLIKNAISPGKEDNLLWIDKSPELNQEALKAAFKDDTVELADGTKINKFDFYSNLNNNLDNYVIEYKQGSKPMVYDKTSDAWKIKQLAANTGTTPNTEILKPTSKTNASEYNQQGYNPIINFSNSSNPIAEHINKNYSDEAIKAIADRSKKLEDAYSALVPKELRNNISLSRYSATDKEALNDYISLYNKLDNQTKKLLTYDKYLENKSFYDSKLK